jgi:antitoxin (DNA-binding transcriptional repressor) of toxin-antitoxin stability system
MRSVGIRELKNSLSQYIRLVEAGESVLVTDRGTVVAEIRPPGTTTQPVGVEGSLPGLAELVRQGKAVMGAPHDPSIYVPQKRLLPPGKLEEILDAERRDVDERAS